MEPRNFFSKSGFLPVRPLWQAAINVLTYICSLISSPTKKTRHRTFSKQRQISASDYHNLPTGWVDHSLFTKRESKTAPIPRVHRTTTMTGSTQMWFCKCFLTIQEGWLVIAYKKRRQIFSFPLYTWPNHYDVRPSTEPADIHQQSQREQQIPAVSVRTQKKVDSMQI